MKKLTNYAPGARGVTLRPKKEGEQGEIVWIEPGETVSIDAARIVEPLPDLGVKPADDESADTVAALEAENAGLRKTVADQGEKIAALTADLEKATKPAK